MDSRPYDASAPLCRALTEVKLTAGLPDMLAQVIWIFTVPITIPTHQFWLFGVAGLLHLGAAVATKFDPHLFLYARRALLRRRLEP